MAKQTGGRPSGERRGKAAHVPDAGDLVWLNFSPQAGREQGGRRPGVVLSPLAYNAKVGLCLVCPITSSIKGYAFEVILPADLPVQGVVLADHIKIADWQDRQCKFIAALPLDVLDEVRAKLKPLVGL